MALADLDDSQNVTLIVSSQKMTEKSVTSVIFYEYIVIYSMCFSVYAFKFKIRYELLNQ